MTDENISAFQTKIKETLKLAQGDEYKNLREELEAISTELDATEIANATAAVEHAKKHVKELVDSLGDKAPAELKTALNDLSAPINNKADAEKLKPVADQSENVARGVDAAELQKNLGVMVLATVGAVDMKSPEMQEAVAWMKSILPEGNVVAVQSGGLVALGGLNRQNVGTQQDQGQGIVFSA